MIDAKQGETTSTTTRTQDERILWEMEERFYSPGGLVADTAVKVNTGSAGFVSVSRDVVRGSPEEERTPAAFLTINCNDGTEPHLITKEEFAAVVAAPPVAVQAPSIEPTTAAPTALATPSTHAGSYAVGACAADAVRRTEVEASKCLTAAWVANDRAGAAHYGTKQAVADLFGLADPNARPADYRFVGCTDDGTKQGQLGYYSAYTCEFDYRGSAGCGYCVLHFDIQATAALGARVTGVRGDPGD